MTTTISALTAASALSGADVTAVDQSGTTKKASMTQIATFIGASPLAVDDGTTTVSAVTAIHFSSGATVSSGGAGIADVAVAGGGGGGSAASSGARLITGVNVSIPNAAGTMVAWDTAAFDTGGYYGGAHPTRLTAPSTGLYQVSASHYWASSGVGERTCQFAVNGNTTNTYGIAGLTPPADGGVVLTVLLSLTAGDYVECFVFQNSGGALNILTGQNLSTFAMVKVGGVAVNISGASTVAGLPGSPVHGDRAFVTDATATTFLSTVAGGGSDKVPVVYDGTNWVIG
jgi:hypothetical protein